MCAPSLIAIHFVAVETFQSQPLKCQPPSGKAGVHQSLSGNQNDPF